jgi:hypothetical protein
MISIMNLNLLYISGNPSIGTCKGNTAQAHENRRKNTMTSFVQVAQPTEHPGVVRAERAAGSITQAARNAASPRGAAVLLLSAIISALLVAANQVGTWTEGHLMLGWIAVWTIAFAALALSASSLGGAARSLGAQLERWAAARRAAAQDEQLWRLALTDARVMADISRAMSSDAARDVRGY